MKKLLFITLLTGLAATASAGDIVTGKSYRLSAPEGKGYLVDRESVLVLTAEESEASTFVAEDCGDGFVLRCGEGRYVLSTPEGEALKTGARYAEGAATVRPSAYTIVVTGENVWLRDKATGLQLNMYINSNGAALHSGQADASQWKILPADGGDAVSVPTEGTDYYLQSQMSSNLGWYAWNNNGTIKLKQTADESCRFRFIAGGADGEWYIHHVATDTEITGGAQGQLVVMQKTSTEEPEDLAQVFILASGHSQGESAGDGGGVTLKAAGSELFLGLTAAGAAALMPEATEWGTELILFPRPDAYYFITSKKNSRAYMTEEKSGAVVVKGYTPAVRCFWQFVPTDREGCYYVRNATTGRYIGSTNKTQNSSSKISTQEEPVEFYIGKNTTEGTATYGYYYFSSTDCSGYDKPAQNPGALNKDGASENVIVWRPTQSDEGSYWSLAETDYLYDPTRSTFARNSQIYQLPCGTKGQNYVEFLAIDHCVEGLNYPRSIALNGAVADESAEPAGWYTLFTANKATVEAGKSFTLTLTLKNAPQTGDELFAYCDWDGNGVFEQTVSLGNGKSVEKTFDVPADARLGKTRLRLRLTANGLDEAEDDVAGQTIDLMLNVVADAGTEPVVEVKANGSGRGKVSKAVENGEVTASARAIGNATFVCWKEGNQVRSVEADYTFTPVNLVTRLVAVFTPNTDPTDAIAAPSSPDTSIDIEVSATGRHLRVLCPATLCEVRVYTANGALVAKAEGLNPTLSVPAAGTYIVKVQAPTGHAAKKITIK